MLACFVGLCYLAGLLLLRSRSVSLTSHCSQRAPSAPSAPRLQRGINTDSRVRLENSSPTTLCCARIRPSECSLFPCSRQHLPLRAARALFCPATRMEQNPNNFFLSACLRPRNTDADDGPNIPQVWTLLLQHFHRRQREFGEANQAALCSTLVTSTGTLSWRALGLGGVLV